MQLSGAATIPAIETALRILAAGNPLERLKLPLNIRHLMGGGEAALTQLAITWAQTRPEPILETFIESDRPPRGGGAKDCYVSRRHFMVSHFSTLK